MTTLSPDPLARGIPEFARGLRRGETSALQAAESYLSRIEALDDELGAYEYVAADQARSQAQAIDQLLRSGSDLGPLMGVPISVKDIFAVDGMPTRSGSKVDVADLVGSEGSFIKRLKQAGCVILGKAKTVEFALGSSGTNYSCGTPRNPWDAVNFRLPSGSSSGSAVAVAAGLCSFSVGSDTGGSIRGPAGFCGVVGVKCTGGLWQLDGAFPLSKTFDSIGTLNATAEDAAVVVAALLGSQMPRPASLAGLRLGKVTPLFEGADRMVAECIDAALKALAAQGAEVTEVDLPDVVAANDVFTTISRPELIATLGRERFAAIKHQMNVDVADRAAPGLSVSADLYIQAMWRHHQFRELARQAMREVDAWIAPSKLNRPPIFPGKFISLEKDKELINLSAGPTRVANTFGLCAISQPVQQFGADLPVGMQIMCGEFDELRLLSIALAVERAIGRPVKPELSDFLRSKAA